MKSGFAERLQSALWFALGGSCGVALHAALGSKTKVEIKWDIPIADLATAIMAAVALATAPSLFSRLERRNAFDRRALTMHLEPARSTVLSVPDTLRLLDSDLVPQDMRNELVVAIRAIRTNLEHVKRIATRWDWPDTFLKYVSDAQELASSLNLVATGNRPFSDRARASELARELDDVLLSLLRLCAP